MHACDDTKRVQCRKPTRKVSIYKQYALQAASDLGYDKTVIDKIKAINDDNQISRIMTQARANNGKLS